MTVEARYSSSVAPARYVAVHRPSVEPISFGFFIPEFKMSESAAL